MTQTEQAQTEKLDPRIWKLAAVVFLGPFMTQLDATVVNVSLSTMAHDLGADISAAQWIVGGYLLSLALMLPLNGWMVDRLGAKRLYLGCFTAFTLASYLCGIADSLGTLIAARIVQGMAGGLLAPMAQLMMAKVAGPHLARVMGYTAVPIIIAPILGPVIAGWILQYLAWPWLFFLNLPIGILAVALAAWLLPGDEDRPQRRAFDMTGFLMISPGLVAALYGLDHASTKAGAGALAVGATLLGAFFVHAKRQREKSLIDLDLLNNKVFNAGMITQFLSNGQTNAGMFVIPLLLIKGFGMTPKEASWFLAPQGLGMLLTFPSMGFLTKRYGFRNVAAGGALAAFVGTLPYVWMAVTAQHVLWLSTIAMFLRGAGQGAIGIPSMSAAYGTIEKAKLGNATTALNIMQRLGGPVATTLSAIVITIAAGSFPNGGSQAYLSVLVFLAILHGAATVSAWRLPDRAPA